MPSAPHFSQKRKLGGSQSTQGSKRMDLSSIGSIQNILDDSLPPKTYFESALASVPDCPVDVTKRNQASICISNPAFLRLRLDQSFRSTRLSPDVFVAGFEEFCEDDAMFMQALAAFTNLGGQSGEMNQYFGGHDSLVRILLGIESIQGLILEHLLVKISSSLDDSDSMRVPKLILSQMKWLDVLYDGKKLTNNLIELLDVCPPGFQAEIIASIPDIITDDCHDVVVTKLEGLMSDAPQHISVLLDALCSLHLPEELQTRIASDVMLKMNSASLDKFPLFIRFLFSLESKSISDKRMIATLRTSLKGLQTKSGKETSDEVVFIIETLRDGVLVKSSFLDTFLKEILLSNDLLTCFEIWVLLIAQAVPKFSKKALRCLKKIIPLGRVRQSTVEFALSERFSAAFSRSQNELLKVADNLVRSSRSQLSVFGSLFYVVLFSSFSAPSQRMSTFCNLISHVGSHSLDEMRIATESMVKIARAFPSAMFDLRKPINALQDFIQDIPLCIVEQLYVVFSQIEVESMRRQEGDQVHVAELVSLLRKQLSNPMPVYQKIGIVGAIVFAMELAHIEDGQYHERALEVLRLAFESPGLKRNHSLMKFYMDKLCKYLRQQDEIPSFVLEDISGRAHENLVQSYLMGLDEFEPNNANSVILNELWFSLEDDSSIVDTQTEESSCALSLFPLLTAAKPGEYQMENLCANLNLLGTSIYIANKKSNADPLEDIEGLLTCPFVLFPEKYAKAVDDQSKEDIVAMISSLLHTINWIRELLNVFTISLSSSSDLECNDQLQISNHMISRCNQMLYIENLLKSLILVSDDFKPIGIETGKSLRPTNNFDVIRSRYYRALDSYSCIVLSFPLDLDVNTTFHLERGEDMSQKLKLNTFVHFLEEFHNHVGNVFHKASFFGTKKTVAAPEDGPIDRFEFLNRHQCIFRKLKMHSLAILQYLCEEEASNSEMLQDVLMKILRKVLEIFQNVLNSNADEKEVFCLIFDVLGGPKDSVDQSFKYIAKFIAVEQSDLPFNVLVVKVLEQMLSHSEDDELCPSLHSLSKELLTMQWQDESSLKSNTVGYLVSRLIRYDENPLRICNFLALNVFPLFVKESPDPNNMTEDIVDYCNTLKRRTLTYYYSSEFCSIFEKTSSADLEQFVSVANFAAETFSNLLKVGRDMHSVKSILNAALKGGQTFVSSITKKIPLFTRNWDEHSSEIIEVLKTTQTGTRQLQLICSHVKRTRNAGLSSKVPGVKKTLETLIYRVKALFHQKGMNRAFMQGVLKKRLIDGSIEKEVQSGEEEDEETVTVADECTLEDETISEVNTESNVEEDEDLSSDDEDKEEGRVTLGSLIADN